MGQSAVKQALETSPYYGCCVVLTTKHAKSIALAPPFEKKLGAGVLEYVVDTDRLGTFSGEIERKGSALDCVRKKCEWSIKKTKAEYAMASEGSFSPHPFIPFLPSNREILYFIDKVRKFHLHISDVTTDTNYQMKEISSFDELLEFANKALFPSHALIVRPFPREISASVFKGLDNQADLEAVYKEAIKQSPENKVWVETDMRAHFNPTRMKFIETLGETLADRLLCCCPECDTPGWGRIDIEAGLPCNLCGLPTDEIKYDIYGCTKCIHRLQLPPTHGKDTTDPNQCGFCNP